MSLEQPLALTNIRERTRNAIAQHRAWRHSPPLEAQIPHVGTSAVTAGLASDDPPRHAAPRRPASRHATLPRRNHCGALYSIRDIAGSNHTSRGLPAAEDVYRDIEAQDQAMLSRHMAKERPRSHFPTLYREHPPLNESMENHLQYLEDQFTSPPIRARSIPIAPLHARTVRAGSGDDERATIAPPPTLYTSLNRVLRGFSIPPAAASRPQELREANNQQIVYRDEGSVMTGMSQQELIRKKKRSLRQQRKPKKFGGVSSKRKSKTSPIVQLPAGLFSLQPSARISLPQHQYYLPHSSVNGEDKNNREDENIASRLAAMRWNSNSRSVIPPLLPLDKELDSFSTTAEITNASGESVTLSLPTSPVIPDRQPMDYDLTSRGTNQLRPLSASESGAPLTSSPVAANLLGEETLCLAPAIDYSLSEPSFPVLPRSLESVDGNRGLDNGDLPGRAHYNNGDLPSRANDNNGESVSFGADSNETPERKGVRFADVVHERYSASDDWSEVPYDQKKDQHQASTSNNSPSSVTEYPKSILRASRFKPDPSLSLRCRRTLDFDSERLLYTSDTVDDAISRRATLGVSQAVHVGNPGEEVSGQNRDVASNYDSVALLQKGRLAKLTEVSSSLEMSPQRPVGFLDTDGLELSPIRAETSHETTDSMPGHPAEKHLRKQLAMVRDMRGGGIAHHVMEENRYPDPPLELNMDDDETVMSAYAFIETVAAIVVQTAVRQFLAALYVDSLRWTRESLQLTSRIRSIEKSTLAGESISRELPMVDDVKAQGSDRIVETSGTSDGDLDDIALNLYHLAAVQIQSVFRGFWIRDCLDVDHYCSTVLQRAFRGYACRTRVQHDINRIITVQSWWRRNIARDEAANVLANVIVIQAVFRGFRVRKRYKKYRAKVASTLIAAAIMIQWMWRGYIVRKRYGMIVRSVSHRRRGQAAATIIQSRWRSFVCEANFIRTLVDVLIAQTVVRRWLARVKVAAVKSKMLRAEKRRQVAKSLQSVVVHQRSSRSSITQDPSLPCPPTQFNRKPSTVSRDETTEAPKGTAQGDTNRQVSVVMDPPGYSGTSRSHKNEQRRTPVGLKSKVVAYPMLDGEEDNGALEITSSSRYLDKIPTKSDRLKDQRNATDTQKQERSYPDVDEQRHDSPTSGTTSSLLSIWKEKEKNAFRINNNGSVAHGVYRKG